MVKKGHKEHAPCIKVRAKAAQEQAEPIMEGVVPPIAAPVGVTLGSVPIGTKFRYQKAVYQKVNQLGNAAVVIDPSIDDVQIQLGLDTIIEPLGPGHEVEADM